MLSGTHGFFGDSLAEPFHSFPSDEATSKTITSNCASIATKEVLVSSYRGLERVSSDYLWGNKSNGNKWANWSSTDTWNNVLTGVISCASTAARRRSTIQLESVQKSVELDTVSKIGYPSGGEVAQGIEVVITLESVFLIGSIVTKRSIFPGSSSRTLPNPSPVLMHPFLVNLAKSRPALPLEVLEMTTFNRSKEITLTIKESSTRAEAGDLDRYPLAKPRR